MATHSSILAWRIPLSEKPQFIRSIMSDSLWPHGLQHTRLPYLSPTTRACSNSCPSSWWCHPAISSSVVPFSSCLQSFPALGSFPMSQFFASGGQSIGVSASASVLPMNIQDWFPLGWTGCEQHFLLPQVWVGHSRWLLSGSLYIPCLTNSDSLIGPSNPLNYGP